MIAVSEAGLTSPGAKIWLLTLKDNTKIICISFFEIIASNKSRFDIKIVSLNREGLTIFTYSWYLK